MVSLASHYEGVLIGLACGDYLGEPAEYCYSPEAIITMFGNEGVRPFSWKRGETVYPAGFYTDDTSQMLCLAHSLLENGFDPHDQLRRYRRWFTEGYMAAIPERGAFGLGQQTLKILINNAHQIPDELGNVLRAGGNGALMRCAPIALYYQGNDSLIRQYSIQSAIVTHNNAVAAWSCVILNFFISWSIGGVQRDVLITKFLEDVANNDCPSEMKTMLKNVAAGTSFAGAPTGYSLNTLQVALEAFFSTDTFCDCITKAIYTGGDTDTQAAVAGAIAGAYYGYDGIPQEWADALLNRNLIADTAQMLLQQKPHTAVAT